MTELICISCPTGCKLEAETRDGAVVVRGNACKRGVAFAQAELTDPRRTVTGTVRTAFASLPLLPVRTDRDIPKARVRAVARLLAGLQVTHPVRCGDVIANLPPLCEGSIVAACDCRED
ncbi:MAG: DUF1667 domain-containing protein [Oscillospiraceae bacterium]|jgi:CxxC motif-containing protein|nr:DUF1667 domain-containing protein [Oscillospiraceae bacterium]